MTVFLLDVTLLLALSDPMHVHHETAHHWFASVGRAAWATCLITETSCGAFVLMQAINSGAIT